MKMTQILPDERPVEKFLSRGPRALSNGELIAILLRTGNREENALELAQRLLRLVGGSLGELSRTDFSRLLALRGVGRKKAVGLGAAIELGRRFFAEDTDLSKTSVSSPEDIYRIMIPRMRGMDHEECWILYLNQAHYLISKEMESQGGMDSTVIDVRRIVRKALDKGATAIAMVHNHPSGNPRPGKSDLRMTADLKDALKAFSIPLIDHVILSDSCYFSFQSSSLVQMGFE